MASSTVLAHIHPSGGGRGASSQSFIFSVCPSRVFDSPCPASRSEAHGVTWRAHLSEFFAGGLYVSLEKFYLGEDATLEGLPSSVLGIFDAGLSLSRKVLEWRGATVLLEAASAHARSAVGIGKEMGCSRRCCYALPIGAWCDCRGNTLVGCFHAHNASLFVRHVEV